nr:SET and MYND domain-containing protein 4-like isoform X2 [Lepeophtheirus salmonis]
MSFLNKLEDFLGSKDAAKKYESKKNRLEHGDQIQILFESKTIQDLFKKEQFTKKKSTLDAKRFRDLGNEAYKSSQDIKALELYSRSCQTSTNDNELALALANRSAAALRLGKWTTALQNVELAIHINSYPPENLYKLHERRAKIYVHMGKKEEASSEYLRASKLVQDPTKASEFITLSEKSFDTFEKEIIVPENAKDKGLDAISFTPNTNFPGLSNAVNIVYEDTKGRFGVATRDIQVGEYIGVEEPVVSRIKKMYQGSHCNGCMQSLEDSCFLPCLHCEDANYCSLVCRSKSFESYHKYECGLSTFLEDALIKFSYKDVRSRVFANGIYSNLAMLNHSCAPNVTKFFRGNKVYVLASAYILKGTEISENYFPYYIFMDKHTRMPWLKDHYCFECNCVACFSNYPLLSDMQKTCPP